MSIQEMLTTISTIGVSGLFIVGLYWLIFHFFKERISAVAQEISQVSIEDYKRQIELYFRDESLRSNLVTHVGSKSIDSQLEAYDKVYKLYFDVTFTLSGLNKTGNKDVQDTKVTQLWEQIQENRQFLFRSSIYLGKLIDHLLSIVISLSYQVEHWPNDPKSLKGYEFLKEPKYNASEQLFEAEKWIKQNLKTHITIESFELNEEELKDLKDKRNEFIKTGLDKSG